MSRSRRANGRPARPGAVIHRSRVRGSAPRRGGRATDVDSVSRTLRHPRPLSPRGERPPERVRPTVTGGQRLAPRFVAVAEQLRHLLSLRFRTTPRARTTAVSPRVGGEGPPEPPSPRFHRADGTPARIGSRSSSRRRTEADHRLLLTGRQPIGRLAVDRRIVTPIEPERRAERVRTDDGFRSND